ncbi:ATP-binding protein [Hansschlegelia sp.]|uniref:ATP-binding protein n=1 Tax=Hansschlegelia sp. TaxID=2041892 RepID=UPI002B650336|nr:ATP-binding protein [Hansschlegelia sp.]HVI29277.1 ATP-binding protein [Hansschlegelia sp.]
MTSDLSPADDSTARKNILQLVQLRWIAVVGQIVTIAAVQFGLGVDLPLAPMAVVLAALVALNIATLLRLRRQARVSNTGLFLALAFDAGALTAQLYFSGGATNPFAFLYLVQVTLSAVLLEVWSTWAMVLITTACFAGLTLFNQPITLPDEDAGSLFRLHIQGMLICFALDAALLVVFVTRIGKNLRERDSRLADLRQRAAEEDHIVRMGLLASGAAHELGTPLATLDVILSDWRRMPKLAADPELAPEIEEMQAEVRRCKAIVTGILRSAGEARGEAPVITTINAFLDDIVQDRRSARQANLAYQNRFGPDLPIVSDTALKQVICNVIDNAVDVSPRWVGLAARREDDTLVLDIADRGTGFPPEMLANLGKPYQSSKGREGGGLGLFLVVNVLRKLGGEVNARNLEEGGALVTLTLPLASLAIEEARANGR